MGPQVCCIGAFQVEYTVSSLLQLAFRRRSIPMKLGIRRSLDMPARAQITAALEDSKENLLATSASTTSIPSADGTAADT